MTDRQEATDLVRRPLAFAVAWGIPIAILVAMNFVRGVLPYPAIILGKSDQITLKRQLVMRSRFQGMVRGRLY